MSDYEKYMDMLRRHPGAIVLVAGKRRLRTFGENAVRVSQRLGKTLVRVNRHRMVTIQRGDLAGLEAVSSEPLVFA